MEGTVKAYAKKPIQCNLRIRPELHRYMKAAAKRRGGSLNGELTLRLEISRAIDTYELMKSSGVSREPRLTD
jgi:HicB family